MKSLVLNYEAKAVSGILIFIWKILQNVVKC